MNERRTSKEAGEGVSVNVIGGVTTMMMTTIASNVKHARSLTVVATVKVLVSESAAAIDQ